MEPQAEVKVLRVIKIADCPTLSGKSNLTYHIGSNGEPTVYFRVHANSAKGYFNKEWVSLSTIKNVLDAAPKQITSSAFKSLFNGKSTNTPGFLMAIIKHEGLVVDHETLPRCYQLASTDAFIATMEELIASEVNLVTETIAVAEPKLKPIVQAKKKPKKAPAIKS